MPENILHFLALTGNTGARRYVDYTSEAVQLLSISLQGVRILRGLTLYLSGYFHSLFVLGGLGDKFAPLFKNCLVSDISTGKVFLLVEAIFW